MRVAWDLQAVTGPRPTGLGVSVGFLLDACQRYAPEVQVVGLRPNDEDQPLIGVPDRLKWEQWRLPRALRSAHRRQPLDLCYSPALGAPLTSPVPVVAHVHDLIPLVYPQSFRGAAGWYWKRLLPYTWQRCRALTVSNATVASDLGEYLGVPRERVHIVPYYPDPQLARIAAELRAGEQDTAATPPPVPPHFITLASHEPRKNIELAIRAVGLLRGKGVKARLTCAGGHTAHTPELTALARQCGVAEAVAFPGYVDRRAATELMLSATALIFVSRYEGYGMPPLEAMSIGCPVVLSNIACHRQVYGDGTMWQRLAPELQSVPRFVMPDDEAGLADELARLAQDAAYRDGLAAAGLAYSALFTPLATAAALERAFRAALAT